MPTHPRFRLRTLLLWVAFVAVACMVVRHANIWGIVGFGVTILIYGALFIVAFAGYQLCRLTVHLCRWVWERGRQEE